jgi:hypothetical protein
LVQLAALEALLEVAGAAPEGFAELYAARLAWLRGFLLHTDAAGEYVATAPRGPSAAANERLHRLFCSSDSFPWQLGSVARQVRLSSFCMDPNV